MSKKIKFGVVGLGHIGKRHAQCLVENPHAVLTSACDVVSKSQWQRENRNIKFYNSFEEILNENLDVINICTPNYLHASMSISALNSGKHVVVEKPMALSKLDAQNIIKASKRNNRFVFGVMQNRFSPTVIWLKNIIKEGVLGEINLVEVNCFWNRNKDYYLNSDWHGSLLKDGGPLFTQFSHFIDIINWIFGDFYNISADFKTFKPKKYIEFEDSGMIKFNLNDPISSQKSILANLTYTTSVWNKNFESSITILGQNGTVKIGGQYMDQVTYCNIKNYSSPKIEDVVKCNDYGDYQGSASNHDKMIQAVLDVLLKNKNSNFLSIEDGVQVVDIIERIYSLRI